LITAELAIAPTVRWGYLYLNQALIAPGYEPPIVIQGVVEETPWIPVFLVELIKLAKSDKA